MKRILIDTDIFIDFLRNNEEAKRIFEKIINENISVLFSVG